MTWLSIQKIPKNQQQQKLELISNYKKVSGHNANIQNSTAFLCTDDEQFELEVKNTTPYTVIFPSKWSA